MQETMKLGHARVLLGDFRAAQWIANNDPDMDEALLRKRFGAIHEFFVRNVRRVRPGLFAGTDPALFVDVIRKWMTLYGETLAALCSRYPRVAGTLDLQLEGTNWSRELGIEHRGLLEIGYFSRYAEVWAEKSLKHESWYRSFEARRGFVGSAAFWHGFELAQQGRLDVVDELGNGVTMFDLIGILRSPMHRGDLEQTFASVGWSVRGLQPVARAALAWYAAHGGRERAPHDEVAA